MSTSPPDRLQRLVWQNDVTGLTALLDNPGALVANEIDLLDVRGNTPLVSLNFLIREFGRCL